LPSAAEAGALSHPDEQHAVRTNPDMESGVSDRYRVRVRSSIGMARWAQMVQPVGVTRDWTNVEKTVKTTFEARPTEAAGA